MSKKDEMKHYKQLLDQMVIDNKLTENIKSIIEHQLKWYITKANNGKKYYNVFNITIIIITAFVPIINMMQFKYNFIIASILSAVASILISISYLKTFKISWQRYGQAAEGIKSEVRKVSVSNEQIIEMDFLNNIEKAISLESSQWDRHLSEKNENAK